MKSILCGCLAFFAAWVLTGAVPGPETYQPDPQTSDIYLPHLKRTSLGGWWKLKKVSSDRKNNPRDEGTLKRYYEADFDDSSWEQDVVPNNIHVPFRMKVPADTTWRAMIEALPKETRTWGGVAWFRKEFQLPALGPKERAVLSFDEVLGDYTVYVNGKKVGEGPRFIPQVRYRGPHIPQSYDVTDALRPGKNTVAVRLFHSGHPVQPWGWGGLAGITDLVYLDVRPQAYTANILVTTRPNRKDLFFECILSGSSASADTDRWTGEIFEWNSGRKAGTVAFGKRYLEDGLALVSGTAHLENPKLWSCESPFLYGIRVRNARGEVTGVQRFGIRTFGVENGNFVLNGKPVFLRGFCRSFDEMIPGFRHGYFHAFRFNARNSLRRYLKSLFSDGNLNHVRMHSSTASRLWYDTFDELGILVTDELSYPETAIKNAKKAEEIAVKGFDGACDKQGNLLPEFVRKMKERIRRSYSHPSIATYSFGNEIRQYEDPRVTRLLNNLYDLFHRVDKQQRPTTNSSGRFWKDASNVKEMRDTEKFDYIDTHDYTGTINHSPISQCEPVAEQLIRTVRKYYGEKMLPIMNGETCYMNEHSFPYLFDHLWKSEDAPQPEWEKYLYALDLWQREHPEHSFLILHWVRNWGARNTVFQRDLGRGIYTELNLEPYRKLWPGYDGYENIASPYLILSNAWPFESVTFRQTDAFRYLARVNSPVIAVLDYLAPNCFSGEEIRTVLNAVNNSETSLKNVVFELVLEQNGKTVSRTATPVGELQVGAKKTLPVKFRAPGSSGTFRLVHRLLSDGRILHERDRKLFVRDRSELFRAIPSKKKIALYDTFSVFGGLKPYSSMKLLQAFQLPFQTIRDFRNLDSYDILVIGSDSIDSKVADAAEKIRKFAENGKRILVFEQSFLGRIPFLSELEYMLAGPGQFSEIVRFDHPAMQGFTQDHFFGWNQKDWSVYHACIAPVSSCALLVGSDTTHWGAGRFGMVASHLKLGKGDVLLCQAEVTKTLKNDSAAARFARKLLETVLDDSTRKDAKAFVGLSRPKHAPLSYAAAAFISLRDAANMGFTDPVERDGKGGWTDQGPTNDLSPFPVGRRLFGMVPFNVIKPEENGGRSCVMQSANPQLKFKPESKPIAVGAKLKRLLFLHSGAWISETSPNEVGEYVVTYESGESVKIPIIAPDTIGDWWSPAPKRSRCECVWTGMNKRGIVAAFLFEWKNPHPEKKIRDIVLKSHGKAVIGLIGLTGEKF